MLVGSILVYDLSLVNELRQLVKQCSRERGPASYERRLPVMLFYTEPPSDRALGRRVRVMPR